VSRWTCIDCGDTSDDEDADCSCDDTCTEHIETIKRLRAEIVSLRTRRDELLATIVRVTNETPFPDEVLGVAARCDARRDREPASATGGRGALAMSGSLPTAACSRCGGTGIMVLPRRAAATFDHVTNEWQTTDVIRLAVDPHLSIPGITQRLYRLVAMGAIERRYPYGSSPRGKHRQCEWRRIQTTCG